MLTVAGIAWATSDEPGGASVVVVAIVGAVTPEDAVVCAGANVGRDPVQPAMASTAARMIPAKVRRIGMVHDVTSAE